MIKRIIFGLCTLFALIAYLFYLEDFQVEHILYKVPQELTSKGNPLSDNEEAEVDKILSRSFRYYDKGSQSYVFIDDSEQYVIKFFKFKHLKSKWYKKDSQAQAERKKRKIREMFEGYRTAYERHKAASGILYAHLTLEDKLHRQMVLRGRFGQDIYVDLDQVYFVIQKKGASFEAVLSEALTKGKIDQAEEKVLSMLNFYLKSYQEGLYDMDHALLRNSGFSGDKPLHFDVGMLKHDFSYQNPHFYEKDLEQHARALDAWFRKEFPKNAPYFRSVMQTYLEKEFKRPVTFWEGS